MSITVSRYAYENGVNILRVEGGQSGDYKRKSELTAYKVARC